MISERAIELIHLRVDGTANAAEAAELGALMAASDEVRSAVQANLKVASQLESAPVVQAPAGMDQEIMRRLRQPARFQSAAHRRRRQYIGIAWAAAALLVAGVALRPLLHTTSGAPSRVNVSEVAGAFAAPGALNDWPMLTRVSSKSPAGSVQMAVHRRGEQLAVELSVQRAETTIPLSIHWDPEKLALSEAPSRTGDQFGKIESGEAILGQTGPGSRLLYFSRRAGPAGKTEISLRISGSKILTSSITLE